MNLLDYQVRLTVQATEERIRSLQRERSLRHQLRPVRPRPEPRSLGRRPRSLAALVSMLVPQESRR
jgi:hypothetical protein